MAGRHEFIYAFDDLSAGGELSIDLDPPANAIVRVEQETGGKVWLSANRSGWLHLARICSELALGSYDAGYHFHRNSEFKWSDGAGPEITFEVRGTDE